MKKGRRTKEVEAKEGGKNGRAVKPQRLMQYGVGSY